MVAELEEAAKTPEDRRAAQAVAVRDVMEQLHSENRFGALRSDTAAAAAGSSGPSLPGVQPCTSNSPHYKQEPWSPECGGH